MAPKLADEIQQSKPFDSPESEAYLNLVRTADLKRYEVEHFLKRWKLSEAGYNALRILRGAKQPLPCSAIGARMVSRVPDVTRLLDRLEARGLVARVRDIVDRRVVAVSITDAGRKMLAEIDRPLTALVRQLLAPLDRKQLEQLISLLEGLR